MIASCKTGSPLPHADNVMPVNNKGQQEATSCRRVDSESFRKAHTWTAASTASPCAATSSTAGRKALPKERRGAAAQCWRSGEARCPSEVASQAAAAADSDPAAPVSALPLPLPLPAGGAPAAGAAPGSLPAVLAPPSWKAPAECCWPGRPQGVADTSEPDAALLSSLSPAALVAGCSGPTVPDSSADGSVHSADAG